MKRLKTYFLFLFSLKKKNLLFTYKKKMSVVTFIHLLYTCHVCKTATCRDKTRLREHLSEKEGRISFFFCGTYFGVQTTSNEQFCFWFVHLYFCLPLIRVLETNWRAFFFCFFFWFANKRKIVRQFALNPGINVKLK